MTAPAVTLLLQGFFTERLVRQLQASPQTISAYRDTIRLLLMFAAHKTKKAPSRLTTDTTAQRPTTRAWPRSTPSTATRCR
jgi:integrase/recombinase XerD